MSYQCKNNFKNSVSFSPFLFYKSVFNYILYTCIFSEFLGLRRLGCKIKFKGLRTVCNKTTMITPNHYTFSCALFLHAWRQRWRSIQNAIGPPEFGQIRLSCCWAKTNPHKLTIKSHFKPENKNGLKLIERKTIL